MKRLVPLILLTLTTTCSAHPTTLPTTRPAYNYAQDARRNPPMRVHVVTVDLRDPQVSVEVSPGGPDPDGQGPWTTTLQPVKAIAQKQEFDIAINASFFSNADARSPQVVLGQPIKHPLNNPAKPVALTVIDGRVIQPGRAFATMLVDETGKVAMGNFPQVPANTRFAVTGSALIVTEGRNTAAGKDPAPRTAIGMSKDGTALVLVVVDGRRNDHSVGMTLPELADEMIRLGCHFAINLDGGGSSTLVMKVDGEYRVVNRPSDGSTLPLPLSLERPVADVVGIRLKKPTTRPSPN